MSRYIDADAVKNIIRSGVSTDTEADQEYVCECIDEASSIEIIRCGECKYWKSTVQMPNGTEVKCLYGRKADDFCSYGEQFGKTEQLRTHNRRWCNLCKISCLR